ncbi:hypothetical protein [Phyllobacterium sp. SB3]|uniref:hypothetical protein n=1 Tax=Phyllobacterium sp. SB3 TaxID=3156073 RepID=UPI0032AEC6AB
MEITSYGVTLSSEKITNNDNSEQMDATTLELAGLIDRHVATRRIIARLRAIHHHYKASPVNCALIEKCIDQAISAEQTARDELLLCEVNNVQQAATKTVHLRNVLLQDEAENSAGATELADETKRPG